MEGKNHQSFKRGITTVERIVIARYAKREGTAYQEVMTTLEQKILALNRKLVSSFAKHVQSDDEMGFSIWQCILQGLFKPF